MKLCLCINLSYNPHDTSISFPDHSAIRRHSGASCESGVLLVLKFVSKLQVAGFELSSALSYLSVGVCGPHHSEDFAGLNL